MIDSKTTITCVGDIAPIRTAQDHFMSDNQSLKKYFEEIFFESDVVFCNLETPLTRAKSVRENKKYIFKAVPEIINAFPDQFVYSIANNHILDYGEEGLQETIKHLSEKGIRFAGAGNNLQEAVRPVVINCRGKSLGFLACADKRYQPATENRPGIFPAIPDLLLPKISQLKSTVDLVVVSIHMGMEYIPVPAPVMIKLSNDCREAGADAVFFHHAHCVSGYTISKNGITLWGVGNFLFPDSSKNHFKPWFETTTWSIIHEVNRGIIDLKINPYIIDSDGIPKNADSKRGARIRKRIELISDKINHGDSLIWLRVKNICSYSYAKLFITNYADIARRKGLLNMFKQITTSIQALFTEKS